MIISIIIMSIITEYIEYLNYEEDEFDIVVWTYTFEDK